VPEDQDRGVYVTKANREKAKQALSEKAGKKGKALQTQREVKIDERGRKKDGKGKVFEGAKRRWKFRKHKKRIT